MSTRKLQGTICTCREQRRLDLTKDLWAESQRISKLRQVQSLKVACQCRNHSEQQLRQVFCLYFNVSLLEEKYNSSWVVTNPTLIVICYNSGTCNLLNCVLHIWKMNVLKLRLRTISFPKFTKWTLHLGNQQM